DKDKVTESPLEGAPNSTSGNVISGMDLDSSPNLLQADEVGADEPPSIIKIVYGSDTYELNTETNTVTKNGDPYGDYSGGKLTISSNLGTDGKLEIQLTGPNAGAYTYT